jgi:hypothetical protein
MNAPRNHAKLHEAPPKTQPATQGNHREKEKSKMTLADRFCEHFDPDELAHVQRRVSIPEILQWVIAYDPHCACCKERCEVSFLFSDNSLVTLPERFPGEDGECADLVAYLSLTDWPSRLWGMTLRNLSS